MNALILVLAGALGVAITAFLVRLFSVKAQEPKEEWSHSLPGR